MRTARIGALIALSALACGWFGEDEHAHEDEHADDVETLLDRHEAARERKDEHADEVERELGRVVRGGLHTKPNATPRGVVAFAAPGTVADFSP